MTRRVWVESVSGKHRLMRGLAGAAALALGALGAPAAQAQDGAYTPPPVEAFGLTPTFRDLRISPSGKRFFALYRGPGETEYSFVAFDLSNGFAKLFEAKQTAELRIRKPTWIRDDRIVFSLGYAGNRYGTGTTETRLFSLQPETGKMSALFKDPKDGDPPVQVQDRIVSLLSDDPTHILIEYFYEGEMVVYRINVDRTANHSQWQRGRSDILSWSVDDAGEVRSGWGLAGGSQRLMFRAGDGDWKDASHRVADESVTFEVVGFPDDPNKAYVASNIETETDALYLYDIPSDTLEEQLFHSPGSDVYGIVQQHGGGEALGVVFAEEDADIEWFGENFVKAAYDQLHADFPGQDVSITSLNATDEHAVVHVSSSGAPGRYFLFDMTAPSLLALPADYPDLEGVPMGKVIPTSYEARDGLTIPAYVTLPPGYEALEDASGLPFIVLPHGGPGARDFGEFDWWTQFLASRGYGVLQMNFRGSTGYGQAFRAAGNKQWGQAMQDDIIDGTNWLIEQGYADASRIAIMGASYGGYAALMGVVKTPDMYQCAVTHGAVTDLPRLIANQSNFVGGNYATRQIGHLWSDRGMLRENSPALHADQIKVPVLMFHGEDDRVVDIDQAERMELGFKRQDREYELIVLPEGSHHLDVGDNRLTFLKEMESFLESCLG